MPVALLLSPDDQAVSAITAVLEEMSVTCDRPLDGVTAAQKLRSHTFDLVLVDCDNLPAAKLIFDVCRRGKGNENPVPIAVVDGRAGLPTAFRLGAELILTKPVAKDQARTTIRNAVNRVKKEEASSVPSVDALAANAETLNVQTPDGAVNKENVAAASGENKMPEERAMAAAASEQKVSLGTSLGTNTSVPQMLSQLLDHEREAKSQPKTLFFDPPGAPPRRRSVFEQSDDDQPEEERGSVKQARSRGPLAAVLVLLLAAAGLYGAWVYEPGFKEFGQAQIERVESLAGIAQQPQRTVPAPAATRPVAQSPAASTPKPVVPPQSAEPAAASSAQPVASSTKVAAAPSTTSHDIHPAAVVVSEAAKTTPRPDSVARALPNQIRGTIKNAADLGSADHASGDHASAGAPSLQAPAIILSSKGAEKRLLHSEQPTFTDAANRGPIVLKTVVDKNGNVTDATLLKGDSVLGASAIRAVKQWRYRPYIRDGKAQAFQTVIILDSQPH
jgi:protein TonB